MFLDLHKNRECGTTGRTGLNLPKIDDSSITLQATIAPICPKDEGFVVNTSHPLAYEGKEGFFDSCGCQNSFGINLNSRQTVEIPVIIADGGVVD